MSYDGIRIQIALTNQAVRSALRGALQAKGFRSVSDASTMVAVHDAIEADHVDMIIASTKLGYDETPLLIKEMRHQRLGQNPFVTVMLLLETADPDAVRTIVSTGTDDLLVMPVSPGQVVSRIETMMRARKQFVITHDYIGPDRRKAERPGSAKAASMDPPNPLSLRSSDIMDENRFKHLIKTGAEQLNRIALGVQARQLGWLSVQLSAPGTDGQPTQPKTRAGHATQMVNTCHDMTRRMGATLAQTHQPPVAEIEDLCRKIADDPADIPAEAMDRIRVLTTFLGNEFKVPG